MTSHFVRLFRNWKSFFGALSSLHFNFSCDACEVPRQLTQAVPLRLLTLLIWNWNDIQLYVWPTSGYKHLWLQKSKSEKESSVIAYRRHVLGNYLLFLTAWTLIRESWERKSAVNFQPTFVMKLTTIVASLIPTIFWNVQMKNTYQICRVTFNLWIIYEFVLH